MQRHIETQLSVEIANTPGEIARISDLLASAGINVRAMTTADGAERGYFRFLCDATGKAEGTLQENGYRVDRERVIAVQLDDQKGKLAHITHALAEAHINIDYFYASVDQDDTTTRLVMKVENVPLAKRVLDEIAEDRVASPALSMV